MKKILITGSSGLIGSEAVTYYDSRGDAVHGIDNNMREFFFGPRGDTTWNLERLKAASREFTHHSIDIRNREQLFALFERVRFDQVIHCAAQPSHDRAGDIPIEDFEVNALGTVNVLEAVRRYCPEAVVIVMSTNKVYGDSPNEIPLKELPTRWEYSRPEDFNGVPEDCRIDRSLHSLFGASKVAADVMAQEYGRYYGLKVGVFRGGCLTGPNHSGVELHGFLNYLVKVAVQDQEYTIFGYKGKQVRDQIHSADVIQLFEAFAAAPRPGEVYNLGGGRENSASVLECISMVEERIGRPFRWRYSEQARKGDHICYISDLRKIRSHFPSWKMNYSIRDIIDQIVCAETTGVPNVA